MPKDSTQTRVVTVDTAKHFIIPIETMLLLQTQLFSNVVI